MGTMTLISPFIMPIRTYNGESLSILLCSGKWKNICSEATIFDLHHTIFIYIYIYCEVKLITCVISSLPIVFCYLYYFNHIIILMGITLMPHYIYVSVK